ncbi:MAG: hypothetical protein ACYCWW_04070 [Deltaproteobacteria bacterium]
MKPRLLSIGLLLSTACPPPAPKPGCQRDTDCPVGEACLEGSCRSLTQVLQNLSVVITPSDATLAPEEIRAVDATQPIVNLFLAAPQLLTGSFVLPASCTAAELLPVRLRFTGHPFLPIHDWTFAFESDGDGRLTAALPAGETFDEWAAPASPCAAPIAATDQALPGIVDVGSAFLFPTGGDVLTVLGNVTVPGGSQPLSGASVTVKSAATGEPLSATVTTAPGAAVGFTLPVPLAQVLAQPGRDGGSCAPPDPGSCDGGTCELFAPCAALTLEVGPSAEQPALATIDLPIVARMDVPSDGGGPTLSLFGSDGLGVRLPLGPGGLSVAGQAIDPSGAPLPGAEVTLDGQPSGNPGCEKGCAFHLAGISDGAGDFELSAPAGSYALGIIPPPGQGFAPSSQPIVVPVSTSLLQISAAPGIAFSGRAIDPSSGAPLASGEVELTDLSDGALIAAADLGTSRPGGFDLQVPPGKYILEIHPSDASGLPERSLAIGATANLSLGDIPLFGGARLEGAVLAEPLDGGAPSPARFASLRFYFLEETQALGRTVALPIAAGLTDAQGHFSVAVPSAAVAQ